MCDIYMASCAVCGKDIPMHLGDFNTKRDEVLIYCKKHLPKRERVMVWFTNYAEAIMVQMKHPDISIDDIWDEEPVIYIESLTGNAWENRLQNHPNITYCIGIPLDSLSMFQYGLEMWTRGQYSMRG